MNLRYVFTLILLINLSLGHAQDSVNYNQFKIGVSAGAFNYNGDIGTFKNLGSVHDLRLGYTASISQRFLSMFSAELSGFYGQLASNERSGTRNLNFESTIMGGQFTLGFHLDNKYMLKDGKFGPYFFGGVGYFQFDSYGDIKNDAGEHYYYWSDGSVRDIAESQTNIPISKKIERDYKYETKLSDPNNNYAHNSLIFPIGLGIKEKLHRNVDFTIQATYYITQTDYLENFKAGTSNDGFWSGTLGLQFNFQKKPEKTEDPASGVDFNALVINADHDGDGVKDPQDKCPTTPVGEKVDINGCSLDKDGDGISDPTDAEPETKKNSFVNDSGVTITDSMFMAAYNDSISMDHDVICKVYPSLCKQGNDEEVKVDPNAKLSPPYSIADNDNDGKITIKEIYSVIDRFFDKTVDVKIQDIHKIIDFFFDQN